MLMAKAYSDDLRRELIEAPQAGAGSLEALARRFHVSAGWTKKAASGQTGPGTAGAVRAASGQRSPPDPGEP